MLLKWPKHVANNCFFKKGQNMLLINAFKRRPKHVAKNYLNWWFIKAVYRLRLILFYLFVYYNTALMPCPKAVNKTRHFNVLNFMLFFSQVDKSNLLLTKFFDGADLTSVWKGQNNQHGQVCQDSFLHVDLGSVSWQSMRDLCNGPPPPLPEYFRLTLSIITSPILHILHPLFGGWTKGQVRDRRCKRHNIATLYKKKKKCG